ncbi:hypothetical protein SAY87_005885 [Trapa incisa]|uniref:Cation/H+ exchanger domain-containing protein n=1 Tax=Trapa incisa TaxID=236973 RepID=A0AAN7K762_9MYRT|nr:hypothetical protein SAY87_005885 [Trapa incisa]
MQLMLDYSLPLFIMMLTLVVVTTRAMVYILKPLKQPRVISEILSRRYTGCREGITLGLLLNTKGLLEMIIFNVGKDQKILDETTFVTMVIVAVVVTGIIKPIFRMRNADKKSILYVEKVVNNGEETVAAIRSIDGSHDLFIVGRGQGMISPLTAGLTEWSECPELGAIGDLLASSDFAATMSVFVVQQYMGFGPQSDGTSTPDTPSRSNDQFINMGQNVRRPQQQGERAFSP